MLLCLLSLVWFAVLAAAARMRRVQLPVALWLSGSTTALAFAALWLTPSKWTHHFGALAGVGTAFLALFLALAVPTVRSVLGMWRLPYGLVAAAAGSYVLAIALSWHGPNQWPYAWLDGVRRPDLPARRSSTCCSTRRCCGCSRSRSWWAGWWCRAGWSAPATRG